MTLPNVVIAGAPRCGTTSLFRWLSSHPDVLSSPTKETRYLVDPGYPLFNAKSHFLDGGLAGYARLFPASKELHPRVCMEATPDYMYQRTALSVLADLPTSPTIVFLLRNPVDRVLSLFGYALNNVGSIRSTLSARDFFLASRDGANSGDEIIDRAVSHSTYHLWLSKWIQSVGRSRIAIYFFDDLVNKPTCVMQDLCGRLNIDAARYRSYTFTVENPTFQVRSVKLSRAKRMVERHAPNLMRSEILKSVYQTVNLRDRLLVAAWDEELKAEMREHFMEPNRQLATLLGRELPPGWL